MIECLTPNIMYETKVSDETSNDCKRYFSASETSFKERLGKHARYLKHTKYGECTKLSNYIFTLKSHGMILQLNGVFLKELAVKCQQITANYT